MIEEILEIIKDAEKKTGQNPLCIAIEGRCASGKTTLAEELKKVLDANVFHMDDFFLQPHQRTEKRLATPGGNVDYERFWEEVLEPLKEGKEVWYRRFDCKSMILFDGVCIKPKRINIIEGAYSLHPYFKDAYDLRIFLDVDAKTQIERLRIREGEEKLKMFIERWIPLEEAYFASLEKKDCKFLKL